MYSTWGWADVGWDSKVCNAMNILCSCCSLGCTFPLGLQDHSIPDSALNASVAETGPANQGRLNNSGFWATWWPNGAWFQVEFKNVTNITAIATQGRPDSDIWVKSYSVYHSFDGQHFQPYHQQVEDSPFWRIPWFCISSFITRPWPKAGVVFFFFFCLWVDFRSYSCWLSSSSRLTYCF